MIPRPRALLIDATAVLYRAYFACRSLIGRDGSQVNAVYGFSQTLLALLQKWQPEHAAAAFDAPSVPTFRSALSADYKRGRPGLPARLAPQFEPAMAAARAMGVPALLQPGFEADDLLATLVRGLRGRGLACLIVAADKDLAQLVGPGVWLCPPGESPPLDAAAVQARYGVTPERIPDLLALRGDPIDNIPGVPGIGDKTARQLLAAAGPIARLWDGPAALQGLGLQSAPVIAEALRQGRGAFLTSRALTTLRDDVPLDLAGEPLVYQGIDAGAVRELCDRLGFDQLRDRILALAGEGESIP